MTKDGTQARAPAREILKSNVIFRRAQAGLSQAALAERADVSRPRISGIENASADVGIDIVERIAIALDTTVADLFRPFDGDGGWVDDNELARRAAAPDNDFVDARSLINAVDEAAGRPARYSQQGRRPVPR